MRHRTIAGGRVIQLAGMSLGVVDQLFQRMDGQLGIDRDDVRRGNQHDDRRKVLYRIPVQFVEHDRVADVEHGISRQHRVAVRVRPGHIGSGDIAAGSGAVFDDDGLLQHFRHWRRNYAHDLVDNAARRNRYDDANRPLGVSGMGGGTGQCRRECNGGQGGRFQDALHRVSSF